MKKSIILSVLILIIFIAAGIGFWNISKERLKTKEVFQLKSEYILISALPEWVPENLAERVLIVSGLKNGSLLSDKELPKKLSEAFCADPWVESVESVILRFPSGADVKLIYRKPAALIEIAPQQFLLIDKNGILLPGSFFQNLEPEKRRSYPQVSGILSKPPERIGSIWNDTTVISAGQLADILAAVPKTDIAKILVKQEQREAGVSPPSFRLLTFSNTEIIWGRFTLADKHGRTDKSTEAKVKRIQAFIEQFHSLDGIPDSLRPVKLPE